ncbi:RsmF rRNA methyltransferase first C-terminal domain-containing protein [Bacillus kwashiorkori]|uniref:RsmF rRNA methyltransferase first C-terminal domain-containing protein n=1 Tax=Bacillus kwashiorkori TaxID=1522318 RepID=UPI0007848BA0|nr:RsmB/NOP family class I SAM-dependent RNA methyltransferase [Bacillus kwashiorkori]
MGLPKDFVEKMELLLAEEAAEFFSSYQLPRTSGLRINQLKITESKWEQLAPFPLEKIPFVSHGYYYPYRQTEPGKHPYHHAGLYYIQEPSAMFIAPLLAVQPGDVVLDLCAAPGGKSTQLAAALNGKGLLFANEIHPKRVKALAENIERMGITNAIVTNETPERLANHFPAYFNKILVDAPCSGEGMFRKDPEASKYWTNHHVMECSIKQIHILEEAYKMLKGEGTIVYSTCTFSPEENEQVIETFLQRHPDMELVQVEKHHGIEAGRVNWTKASTKEIEKSARLWPHRLKGEGHFAAKLIKQSETITSVKPLKNKQHQISLKDFANFQEKYLQNISFNQLSLFGSHLHELPDNTPNIAGLKIQRFGLHLGELKKNRFEPNHALALAIRPQQVKQTFDLPSSSNLLRQYLKGETIACDQYKGWVLITMDGFPLGWGKASNGQIKNYYPKGLRIL